MRLPLFQATNLIDEHGLLHPSVLAWVARQQNAVLLETSRPEEGEHRNYLFLHPIRVVRCTHLAEIESSLHQIHLAVREGYYAAGFMSYEAGYAFEERLDAPMSPTAPLLWFGIYDAPAIYDHQRRAWATGGEIATLQSAARSPSAERNQDHALDITPALSEAEYHQAIAAIRDHIARGDTYQVNFTFKLRFPCTVSPSSLYWRLRDRQRVSYSALLACGNHAILSFSPELFFRIQQDEITLKPMKGTAPRGCTPEEDELQRRVLLHSEKNRAENLMIVDLLRNDVGRVAETGSVQVSRFFDLEGFETVWQATSTITAKLRPHTTVLDLMRSMFPCGSVTGAPKIHTMQIIRTLEKEPRGVYTGCIGFFAPHLRHAVFNVAIRTVVLDHATGMGEMGVGSGVVWDSDSEAEYRECLLKARFLSLTSMVSSPSHYC
ncbi:MAG: aminodeoxychorismate synthase component I [bacterium]